MSLFTRHMTPNIATIASLWLQFFRLCGVCVVCVGVGLHVCAHWSQRLTMDAFFCCALPCLPCHWSWSQQLSRLGGQDVGGIPLPLLPSTRSKGTHYHAWLFYMGPRELNSGSQACSGSPLWNITSFQAYTSNFYSRLFYVALWHSPLIGLPDLCGAEFMKNINTHELTEFQTNSSVS